MLTQIHELHERLVGVSDISSEAAGRLVKNIKMNNLPTGNLSGSHATPGQPDSANRGNLAGSGWEERRDEGQFIIANTSLAGPGNRSQEAQGPRQTKKVQTSGTSSIPTNLTDFPSSPGVGPGTTTTTTTTEETTRLSSSTAEPKTSARKYKKETTILEPTFLFSTQTSTFTAAMKSHFFKVATVEVEANNPTEANWKKSEYEIVTESSQSQVVSEDMTEVIIIRKCSYCGFYKL